MSSLHQPIISLRISLALLFCIIGNPLHPLLDSLDHSLWESSVHFPEEMQYYFLQHISISLTSLVLWDPKRWVFPPRLHLENYSAQIIYCCLGFFLVYSQSDLFPPFVLLHYSYATKSLARESILSEDISSLNTSVTHN